jgi:hypothetical protein
MIREKVPRKTPRIAKAVLSLKFASDRSAILRFRNILFIDTCTPHPYPLPQGERGFL